MRKFLALLTVLVMSIGICAFAQGEPVIIENMGRTTVYEKAPERAFLFSYSMAEFFAALGLEEHVIAIVPGDFALEEVSEEYRDIVANMPLVTEGLKNGCPHGIETVLEQDPDFAFGDFYNFLPVTAGAPEDYEAANIKIYATQGTCSSNASLNDTYEDILKSMSHEATQIGMKTDEKSSVFSCRI